uniref:ATP-dependent DNA helicase n=1 Tax=Strongyloides venezuelensis TaxID=75913 RepID=A0A0K0F1J9_STRVS
MSTLKETFEKSKPKPRIQYGQYSFVQFPDGYKIPDVINNLPKMSDQKDQRNTECNYTFQVPQNCSGHSSDNDSSLVETFYINTQQKLPNLSNVETQNYGDENYDDFYDDSIDFNDSNNQSSTNNNNIFSIIDNNDNSMSKEYNSINDTIKSNNNISNNNISDDYYRFDDSTIEGECEDDIYDEEVTYLKSDVKEFANGHELLPQDKLQEMNKILNEVFGYSSFKEGQKEAIIAGLVREDVFVLMPGGNGKSLCYQVLGVIDSGITVVVCPLKGGIEDEVSMLTKLDVPVQSLTCNIDKNKYSNFYGQVLSGKKKIKLLYVIPEIINGSENFQQFLLDIYEKGMLSRFVIKDAQCISKFSHNFRTDCTGLNCLRDNFQNVKIPIMLLSSATTPKVVLDVLSSLNIRSSKIFTSSFERSNIKYDVIHRTAKSQDALLRKIKNISPEGSGIFYCFSKKDCEALHNSLKDYGLTSVIYHGGMDDRLRREAQQKWMSNEVQVICATTAFGVSVKKRDVRYVVHFCMPMNVESYYNESGLAGRDGLPSYSAILYSYLDSVREKNLIEDNNNKHNLLSKDKPSRRSIRFYKVNQILWYCESIHECRRKFLLQYFGEKYDHDGCLRDSKTVCNSCEISINRALRYKFFDFTCEAEGILKTTIDYTLTMKQMSDCYRGRVVKKRSSNEVVQPVEIFGKGSRLTEEDANRFIIRLIIDGYLKEDIKIIEDNNFTKITGYLMLTSKGRKFLSSTERSKIHIYIEMKQGKRRKTTKYDLVPKDELF